jgi:hypothetical protein
MGLKDWISQQMFGLVPLDEETRKHPFVKSIFGIGNSITSYNGNQNVRRFLTEQINWTVKATTSAELKVSCENCSHNIAGVQYRFCELTDKKIIDWNHGCNNFVAEVLSFKPLRSYDPPMVLGVIPNELFRIIFSRQIKRNRKIDCITMMVVSMASYLSKFLNDRINYNEIKSLVNAWMNATVLSISTTNDLKMEWDNILSDKKLTDGHMAALCDEIAKELKR